MFTFPIVSMVRRSSTPFLSKRWNRKRFICLLLHFRLPPSFCLNPHPSHTWQPLAGAFQVHIMANDWLNEVKSFNSAFPSLAAFRHNHFGFSWVCQPSSVSLCWWCEWIFIHWNSLNWNSKFRRLCSKSTVYPHNCERQYRVSGTRWTGGAFYTWLEVSVGGVWWHNQSRFGTHER